MSSERIEVYAFDTEGRREKRCEGITGSRTERDPVTDAMARRNAEFFSAFPEDAIIEF